MEIERLGPYQIVGKLGRGGMGTVYKGIHSETREPAAVKLLSAGLAEEEDFRVRFEAEIKALLKLNHPNIVRLLGFSEQDEHLFYAMELVDGRSLEEELRAGRRFECREVTRIGIETCRALRHAHDRGIIHRDIKPANLLLSSSGVVKLSDFGIARLFGYSRLTSAGNVLGTAEYMAPEQAEGRPVDARADLYSLGAVMYALLAGRPVFRGKSLPEMLRKQRLEIPDPLRKYAPDVPEELERILAQLLEKDPNRRIPNAAVLGRLLEAMSHWLNMGPETIEAGTSWFDPNQSKAPPTAAPSTLSPDDMPPTRLISESEKMAGRAPTPPQSAPPSEAAPAAEAASEAPVSSGRFVHVGEDELDRAAEEQPRPSTIWQTAAMVAALLLLWAGAWWSLQPPTADALYNRILAKKADELITSKSEAEQADRDIREFLYRFPGDPRAADLRSYEKTVELSLLELEARLPGAGSKLPVARAYREASNYDPLAPERSLAKLQALVDLYGGSTHDPGPTAGYVALAQRRLAQLQKEVAELATSQIGLIEQRLETADQLRESDPERAREMYRAVVELYGVKPWAAGAVGRARDALRQMAETSGEKQP